jgi:DNA-binding response OmpR family regulator
MQIAILEDDLSQLELIAQWVNQAGHNALPFHDANAFLRLMVAQQLDMLLLDWNLREATGIDVLRRLRQVSTRTPVLFCTASDDQDDVVKALREGADGYLVKPIRRIELLARIDTVARRTSKLNPAGEAFEVHGLHVDGERRTVVKAGVQLELTAKDFDLAVLFLRNVGRLLSRRQIQEAVWATNAVTSRTIDTHVSRLRSKLGLVPKNGWQLKAVYANGYRLEKVARAVDVQEAA